MAGDAFTTVVGESALATLTQQQVVHGPPAYFTPDWDAARLSVAELLSLSPEVAATGHGIAMHGEALRHQLAELGVHFNTASRPRLGRYAKQPATADASGVLSVPPPLLSPWVKELALAGLVLAFATLAAGGKKQLKTRRAW